MKSQSCYLPPEAVSKPEAMLCHAATLGKSSKEAAVQGRSVYPSVCTPILSSQDTHELSIIISVLKRLGRRGEEE